MKSKIKVLKVIVIALLLVVYSGCAVGDQEILLRDRVYLTIPSTFTKRPATGNNIKYADTASSVQLVLTIDNKTADDLDMAIAVQLVGIGYQRLTINNIKNIHYSRLYVGSNLNHFYMFNTSNGNVLLTFARNMINTSDQQIIDNIVNTLKYKPASNTDSNNNTDSVDQISVNGVKIKIEKNKAKVVGVEDKKVKEIAIPETVSLNGKTYTVTAIADNAFEGCSKLKKVTGGKALTSIGANAFKDCNTISKFSVQSKVKTIGANCFNGCKKLKEIHFDGTALRKIGKGAFEGIAGKAEFTCPEKKLKAYKKLIKAAGAPDNAVFIGE